MRNKRGQELSTTTIILIILGVLVLVILIAGFVMGWDRIAPFLTKNNVGNVADACNAACSTLSTYDFCGLERKINDGENDEFKATCYELATNADYTLRNYGIKACPEVKCTTDSGEGDEIPAE